MNRRILAGAFLAACTALAAAPSANAQAPALLAFATYNRTTGTVKLDIGAGLGVVGIETKGKVITGLLLTPPPQQYDANVIAYFNPSGIAAQTITLTNAFATGLISSDFVFGYVRVGGPEVLGTVWTSQSDPEPASFILAMTCTVAVTPIVRAHSRKRRFV